MPPPVASCSSTKWQERQLIELPAKGPGSGVPVVSVVSTTGSPAASGSFTPVGVAREELGKPRLEEEALADRDLDGISLRGDGRREEHEPQGDCPVGGALRTQGGPPWKGGGHAK